MKCMPLFPFFNHSLMNFVQLIQHIFARKNWAISSPELKDFVLLEHFQEISSNLYGMQHPANRTGCIGSACSPIPSLAPGPNCSAGSFAPLPSSASGCFRQSIKTQHQGFAANFEAMLFKHAARAESFQLATRPLPGSCSRWSRPMLSSLSLVKV